MASNTTTITIEAQDKASSVLQRVHDEIANTGRASEEAAPKTSALGGALDNMGSVVTRLGEYFIAYKLGDAVYQFGANAVATAGQLEQTNIAFQSLIGNASEANSVFGQLVQYANVTPFQSKDVVEAANTLMGFGTSGQQTVDILKQLGDVTSVGGGNLQQLSLVTGQIFAQGKLRAQDMYQVINDGGAGLVKIMAQSAGGMQNLTAEFESGGIPAQQYFDAVNTATGRSGFAFQGAQREADTFNGRLSTLKDATTQFGMALLGVHVDPQLGYQVQPGGLFDRMRSGIKDVSDELSKLGPAVSAAMPEVFSRLGEVAGQVRQNLGPAFNDLWRTVNTQVLPVLSRLWKEVVEPLAPAFGGALLTAINGVVTALSDLFKIVVPVLNFMLDHKGAVDVLAGAFLALGASMALGAAFDAIKVGVATLQLVTLPGFLATVATMSSAFAAAFPVAGILADIALVYKAVETVKQAFDDMHAASASAQGAKDAYAQDHQTLLNLQKNGNAGQKSRATEMLNQGYALGTSFARGGPTLLGENGPEIVDLPTGSKVTPARQTQQMLGGNKAVNIGSMNVYNQVDANAMIRKIGFRLAIA